MKKKRSWVILILVEFSFLHIPRRKKGKKKKRKKKEAHA
jgi:hypothetical protein